MNTPKIEAMLFTTHESYLHIYDWMKACGSTHADEVQYRHPLMLINTPEGTTQAAHPGDWVVRGTDGNFRVGL